MKKLIFTLFIPGYFALIWLASCWSDKTTNTIAADSLSISQGQVMFQQNCSGCHGFHHDGIGPNLSGITESDSINWLKGFIRSPKTMIDSGDEHAKELLANYHSLMPSFTSLKDEDIDRLIAFLHTQKGFKKPAYDPLALRDPIPEKIAASNIQIELEFFTQLPASSDKQPLTRISKMDWISAAKT